MKSNLWIVAAILGLGLVYLVWEKKSPGVGSAEPDSLTGRIYSVKRVQVLKADQFDLVTTEPEIRVLARLSVRAVEGAKPQVVSLLNHCENPRVRLLSRQAGGDWVVDFRIVQNGKEVDLASWLSEKKLVYK